MKPFINAGILAGSAVLVLSTAAAAQETAPAAKPQPAAAAPAPEATAPAAGPAATTEANASVSVGAATEAEAEAAPAAVEPEPAPMEEMPPPGEEPPPAEETPAEEAAAEETTPLSFSLFVDANYAFQSSREGTAAPLHRAYGGSANLPQQGGAPGTLVNDTGFQLSVAGIDAVYDQGQYGATVSLRFGSSIQNYHFNSIGSQGTVALTQAFGTWTPLDMLSFDIGMFGTIFGAEVLESWQNLNYTRGGLYFGMQPFWHTGVRATVTLNDAFAIKLMATNAANTSWNYDVPDSNVPTGHIQFAITPSDVFNLYVGGSIAEDNVYLGFETFADLVATLSIGDFSAIFNGDINYIRSTDYAFGGVSLAVGYQFLPVFGVAYRQEVLFTPLGIGGDQTASFFNNQQVTTTQTLTLDFKPIKDSSNVIIRLEGRVDWADFPVFYGADSPLAGGPDTDLWGMGILGVVVTTDG